jgi:GcrA cell cycle regulator
MIWTSEADARLRALHAEGKSYTAIGAELGCGKNAVVGRTHRLKLPLRGSPIGLAEAAAAARAAKRSGGARVMPQGASAAARMPSPGEAASPSPPVQIAQGEAVRDARATPSPAVPPAHRAPLPARLTSFARKCRFPLWKNGDRPDGRFCDAPSAARSSYCAAHHAKCHTTPHAWVRGNLVGLARPGRAA